MPRKSGYITSPVKVKGSDDLIWIHIITYNVVLSYILLRLYP